MMHERGPVPAGVYLEALREQLLGGPEVAHLPSTRVRSIELIDEGDGQTFVLTFLMPRTDAVSTWETDYSFFVRHGIEPGVVGTLVGAWLDEAYSTSPRGLSSG